MERQTAARDAEICDDDGATASVAHESASSVLSKIDESIRACRQRSSCPASSVAALSDSISAARMALGAGASPSVFAPSVVHVPSARTVERSVTADLLIVRAALHDERAALSADASSMEFSAETERLGAALIARQRLAELGLDGIDFDGEEGGAVHDASAAVGVFVSGGCSSAVGDSKDVL